MGVDFPFNIVGAFPVSGDARPSDLLGLVGNATVDRQTFDRLVLDHLPAALRFAVRLTGRVDLAEDVLQEALTKASRAWHSFAGQCAFRTWLFQIVLNAFRDDLDKRARRPVVESLEFEVTDRRESDPATAASVAELGRTVAAAVSSLPPRQREVMVLHMYEQLSDADVATILAVSPQVVRTTLHLARKKLREQLQPYLSQ